MTRKIDVDTILLIIFIVVIPVVMVIPLSFIFISLLNPKYEIVQSLVVLPVSFILMPSVILSRYRGGNLGALDSSRFSINDVLISVICLVILYWFLLSNYDWKLVALLSAHTIIVAISEEFWARGILFHVLRQICKSEFVIILLSSLIFVFVTHMNRDFIENLLYRLPGALIMGFIYSRTGKLQYSVLFHFTYNILGSL